MAFNRLKNIVYIVMVWFCNVDIFIYISYNYFVIKEFRRNGNFIFNKLLIFIELQVSF